MIDHHSLAYESVDERIETRRREAHIAGLMRTARRAARGDAAMTSAVTDLSACLAPTAPPGRESARLPGCCGPACCPAQAGA